jgi:hypothetical protein
MNRKTLVLLMVALSMIGATAATLTQLRANQKLGRPGVKTSPLADSSRLQVDMPVDLAGFASETMEVDKVALAVLPADTSFGQRIYKSRTNDFQAGLSVVLMGSDRTSLHKPQFCLSGTGWHIDDAASSEEKIQISKPSPYELPVTKLVASQETTWNGETVTVRRVYVYWFVADGEFTGRHWERMWWMARDLMRTGVLQRWAYVACFSNCLPGQEAATFEKIKGFIAEAVPELHTTPTAATVMRQ